MSEHHLDRPQYDPNLHAQRIADNQPPEGLDRDYRAPSQPAPPPSGSYPPPAPGSPYPYMPGQYPYAPVQPPRKKPWPARHPVLLVIGILGSFFVVLAIAGAALSGGNSSTPTSAPAAANAPATQSATTPAAVATTTAAPSMTSGQQQAVESAQNYLNDGQGFSEQGLLDQLTSSAGEGFSKSDAEFAIKHLHPDWNAQAVESAKNYLKDGQGFSRADLLDQLTSSAGEGFTYAQAEYALKKVGM